MEFLRPKGLLAGFHACAPDPRVPELIHAGEQWAPADFFIPEHTHPVWEFYFQISGESQWDGGGKSHALKPGGFFAAAPSVRHRMRERPKARHHFLYAAIDLDLIGRRIKELSGSWRGRRIVSEPHAEALLAPFRQLIREVSALLPHRTAGIRTALDTLVIEATRLLEKDSRGGSLIAGHPAVVRCREILDHHPAEQWKLAELARLAGLSPSRLSECFMRDTGLSPHQYLLHARIETAKEMLRQSDVSVTTLALDLGFSSSQHFATTFKRVTGGTAHAYRQHASAATHA
jgi:AraC-like DNA-binding protein